MARSTTPTAGAGAAAPKRLPRVRKRSVRTSDARKAEIAHLHQEAALLRQQLAHLQRVVTGDSSSQSLDECSLEQRALENALVREQLRNHKFLVAGLKSALAADTSEHIPSPVSSPLRLGADSAERWAFLRGVKAQKLHDARQFFRRRTQLMDMTRPFSEATQFQAPGGEICAAKLDVFPLAGARSVKQVYDVLLFYALNVEMCTAEMNGDVVVREEAETGDESVSQNRFVFATSRGVQLEANNILFCEYAPSRAKTVAAAFPAAAAGSGGLGPYESGELDPSDEGLITLDFVDDDALYPYRPDTHLRDDITSIFLVKSYPVERPPPPVIRRRSSQSPTADDRLTSDQLGSTEDSEHVIVFGRWVQSKFHHSGHRCLSNETLFELRREQDRVNDAIVVSVLDRFKSSAV